MTPFDVVFQARRAVTTADEVGRRVGVRDGRTATTEPHAHRLAGGELEPGPDTVLLPGLVDTHLHRTRPHRVGGGHRDCHCHRHRHPAAAGWTTLPDLPPNPVPPTTDPAALAVRRAVAAGHCPVDVGFWTGRRPGADGTGRSGR